METDGHLFLDPVLYRLIAVSYADQNLTKHIIDNEFSIHIYRQFLPTELFKTWKLLYP